MSQMIKEPRPKSLTSEMRLRAAERLVASLVEGGLIKEDEVESASRDIAKVGRSYMDGYQLAKELDSLCYWDCDLQMAEALDAFGSYAREEIRKAEGLWAEKESIIPPLPIGTRIRLHSGKTGIITAISEWGVAKYLIAVDGDYQAAPPTNARLVVNFEDVEEISKPVENSKELNGGESA